MAVIWVFRYLAQCHSWESQALSTPHLHCSQKKCTSIEGHKQISIKLKVCKCKYLPKNFLQKAALIVYAQTNISKHE